MSDLAVHVHLGGARRTAPRCIDLQSMVRISGKSFFYLPAEYAPRSLVMPTCLRATAQYLLQHGGFDQWYMES